jgi:hypothetical protein
MKYVLVGMLLVAAGSAAFSQTDTTKTPTVPDTISVPEGASASIVRRAVVCTSISNHEPTDSLTLVPSSTGKVFFFTEIAGLEGKTITHRWIKDGTKVADIRISIASNRYRCHSSRSVSGKTGDWSVQVLDEDGDQLMERQFTVGTPTAQSPLGKT